MSTPQLPYISATMTDVKCQDGARYRFPIQQIEAAYALDQDVAQATASFAPGLFSIPSTAYGLSDANAVLQEEKNMANLGSGVSRWMRSFYIVPKTWNDWEMFNYTFPGFPGYLSLASPISITGNPVRNPFTLSVLSRIQNDYFMVGIVPEGAVYNGLGNYTLTVPSGISMIGFGGSNDTSINGTAVSNLASGTYSAVVGYPVGYGGGYKQITISVNTQYAYSPGANDSGICVGGTVSGGVFNTNGNPIQTGKITFNSGSATTVVLLGTSLLSVTATLTASIAFTCGSTIALVGTANTLITSAIGPAVNDAAGKPAIVVNSVANIPVIKRLLITVVNNPSIIDESCVPSGGTNIGSLYYFPTTPNQETYISWIANALNFGWLSGAAYPLPPVNVIPIGSTYGAAYLYPNAGNLSLTNGVAYSFYLGGTVYDYGIAVGSLNGAYGFIGFTYTTGMTLYLIGANGTSSGKPVTSLIATVIPASSNNPGQIVAEDSVLKRYVGNIWCRRTRYILAQ